MFHIIISIIAISLVSMLAFVTVKYGSSAYNKFIPIEMKSRNTKKCNTKKHQTKKKIDLLMFLDWLFR